MKVFVIGATGFVGSAVARAFKGAGHEVAGLARSAGNEAALAAAGVGAARGDTADLASLAALVRPFEVIVMAAMIPFDDEAPLMHALVEACRDGTNKHLLFTSGSGVLSIE